MKRLVLSLVVISIFLLNIKAVNAQTMLPPKYWRYELKPYYSKIIAVNSSYFIIEKQLYSGKTVQYVYDQVQNKYTPLNPKYADLKCLNTQGAGFYAQKSPDGEKILYGFLNFDKKIFKPCVYMNFQPFKNGTAVVQYSKNQKYYIINELGNAIAGPIDKFITGTDEQNLRLKRVLVVDNAYHSHHEYIFTDAMGNNVFNSKKFLSAHPFINGYAMVATDRGKCGYIDTTGKLVVPYKYTNCSNYNNGSALAYNPETKNTIIIDKHLKPFVVNEDYGSFTANYLQHHDPNGLVIYSKYTNKHKDVTLPRHYKTIYARKHNGEIVIPAGLYFEGEHVYKDYYLFKKYELREDEFGSYLVKSDNTVLIDKHGKVYDSYEKIKELNIPLQYIAELKKEKLMALDKNISGEHRFSWVNLYNKKGTRDDNTVQIMEGGLYGIIKFNK